MISTGEISDSLSMRSSKVSRTLTSLAPPPTPSKPTTPVSTPEFGRQRLKVVPTEPAAPTPFTPTKVRRPRASSGPSTPMLTVLIDTPFEPVSVIG
ncbi:hypothetical protein D3C80_1408460 [compost metagenome]